MERLSPFLLAFLLIMMLVFVSLMIMVRRSPSLDTETGQQSLQLPERAITIFRPGAYFYRTYSHTEYWFITIGPPFDSHARSKFIHVCKIGDDLASYACEPGDKSLSNTFLM
ncbi:hypothetical protein EV421DRAFT_1732705 [Armillaria borealis]|uniref:Uncharacterized protein n=1 Tax=Armillaria borealis TaxID=47425 RepID=A0AA39MWB8_9AGAR|nr:hypothetical protein EV421DRAFT_1732705 [Armillaria borealis]